MRASFISTGHKLGFWEEGTLTEKMLPSKEPVGKPAGHTLHQVGLKLLKIKNKNRNNTKENKKTKILGKPGGGPPPAGPALPG